VMGLCGSVSESRVRDIAKDSARVHVFPMEQTLRNHTQILEHCVSHHVV